MDAGDDGYLRELELVTLSSTTPVVRKDPNSQQGVIHKLGETAVILPHQQHLAKDIHPASENMLERVIVPAHLTEDVCTMSCV